LGFANRPLSLPPQFFANKPLDLWFREGVRAEMLNRFTLGRTLEEVYAYGCERLCSAFAMAVCVQEGIERRFPPRDTTRFALSGDDRPDSDEQAITSTHGSSQDHRPDFKQAVVALLVAQDGGVPLVSKSWDGHASDTQMFQERAAALMQTFTRSPTPCSRVADAKLSTEDNAPTLSQLGCITRSPGTLKLVSQVIRPALQWDMWQRLDDTTRSCGLALCHYGMAQRGLGVSSPAALERANTSVDQACQRASATIQKPLFPLQATRFATPEAAQSALDTLATSWRYHQGAPSSLLEHQRYAGKGRPAPTTPIQSLAWQMEAQSRPEQERMRERKQQGACLIIGTHMASRQWSAPEVMHAYKAQSRAEGGCRLLTDPLFFVSSLFVKKPSRMQGLLMVMPLAWLVYAVTHRRLRPQ
jgi:transposase